MSAEALYGAPQVMRFRGGKPAAFTMQFDDSMETQAAVAVPELNARGLVATFYVNPDTQRYGVTRDTWEVVCPQSGHELANHTMRHEGARDYAEAEHEIGECSRLIWQLYPGVSKLRPFARGGATTWSVSDEQVRELMRRYFLFRRDGGRPIADEYGTGDDPAAFARQAIEKQEWVPVHFHGIGGEWLSVSARGFLSLLDFLAENRDKLWIATAGAARKYQQEYAAASCVLLTDAAPQGFSVSIECDEAKADTFGAPFTELHDEPLTVRVRVPGGWQRFTVTQGRQTQSGTASGGAQEGTALIDVWPNRGNALVARVE
jgi:hypothetical protein